MKYLRYEEDVAKQFFWRTTQQQEIDLIEENDSGLTAFEFKWNAAAPEKKKPPPVATSGGLICKDFNPN